MGLGHEKGRLVDGEGHLRPAVSSLPNRWDLPALHFPRLPENV